MRNVTDILRLPESRKLEFSESLPGGMDLARTAVAFANDAGGTLYIGIKDHPRSLTGVDKDKLIPYEEKIIRTIHDLCEPPVLPEISFLQHDDIYIIKVQFSRGSNPPYHIRNKSIEESTYIRMGSANRRASREIIRGLERQRQNISFDSELCDLKTLDELDLGSFKTLFLEKTGVALTRQTLKKLGLFRTEHGRDLPTNALVLLSGGGLRKQLFPNAIIECARFKGTVPGNFIDRETIDAGLGMQPEQAFRFVLRHISMGSADCTGVYRDSRREYPVNAIREVITNAVIHRDYSLSGKGVQIAVFDDRIEVTSPGTLLPTVDFNDMLAGQSDIRNKTLAPVFKRLGIIEQWGGGLKRIAEELQDYPEIGFKWEEPGLALRVTFIRKKYLQEQEWQDESQQELQYELQHELQHESLYGKILRLFQVRTLSTREISVALGQKTVSGQLRKVLAKLLKDQLVEWTEREANSPLQQYRITRKGIAFIKLLDEKGK
ncbi:MAG: putative DNA binding domain-containing protein [Bacteroidales bacterium]|nr:putative DNA binding domain-containing protein [Bacteroidales bacterium]